MSLKIKWKNQLSDQVLMLQGTRQDAKR